MKLSLLRSLRPETFKILVELATAYHRQFDRPLPVSSLAGRNSTNTLCAR
jgi:hypothetical protein